MAKPRFKPGEIAVLRTPRGGRLFQVERTVPYGESYKVFETKKHSWSGNFDVWEADLVKVEDEKVATQLVAILGYINEKYGHAIRKLEHERSREFREIIDTLKMDVEEEETDDEV